MHYDLVVIGGGPAGMMAAATAAQKGLQVLLIEKNEKLGKKLYITGKGRCNVTNYGDMEDFFDNIVTNKKFLYSALYTFNNYQLVELLNNLGVKTKIERGSRVFPESDKSSDIIKGFERYLKKSRVDIRYNNAAKKILTKDNRVTGVLLKNNEQINCNNVLIATGGMSYQHTGSTGDGYQLAGELGHTVIEPKPALVPLVTGESWVKELQGLTLKNVTATLTAGGKTVASKFGEMLFTHFGVSGPIILSLSSLLNKNARSEVKLFIDLKPALSDEQLDQRIQRDFRKYINKQVKNALNDLLPKRLIPVIIKLTGLSSKVVNQVTKKERLTLVHTLKSLQLTVTGTRPLNEAIITSGGISTGEINPSTLESKLVQGLYFAGEVIDVDALTGGYNLQIAFSTGYLSGKSAAEKTKGKLGL
ncbi:putative Rossmann fold flavoprotein [Desulfohalotomaculum tongense]|uniref:NAD(P)/FAD-dependent oxidoreductase n=1 Tax=Desulforadius tongensis TaxID=1216062 RepID=UPI001957704E|nr:NAD(P)/FAD-dependent oxidoreductase [Desulforadius tongensis]MBM7854837.1 putative Rossmann fold flavoprotein [Desulforadius tongensis]